MNILSFDVGGTTIKAGLVKKDLEIQEKFTKDTPKNEESFISLIEEIHKARTDKCDKVSFGMPGFVDRDNYVFKYGTNMKFSIDFKKLEFFGEKKLYIENDGNLAAYSEFVLNLSEKYKNVIMLTFGTGIGGGIITDSKIYKGGGNAGEIGHILIKENSNLEDIISAKAWTSKCNDLYQQNKNSELSERFREKKVGSLLFDQSINLEDNEKHERDEIIKYTSRGLISLFELFDNELFVIGGSMTQNPYDFLSLIKEYIKLNFEFPSRAFPEIILSKSRADAGLLGSALLALNSEK